MSADEGDIQKSFTLIYMYVKPNGSMYPSGIIEKRVDDMYVNLSFMSFRESLMGYRHITNYGCYGIAKMLCTIGKLLPRFGDVAAFVFLQRCQDNL